MACRKVLTTLKIKMQRNAKRTEEGKLGRTKSHFTCFTIFINSQPLKYGRANNMTLALVNVFHNVFHGPNSPFPYQDDIDFMPKMMQHICLTTY